MNIKPRQKQDNKTKNKGFTLIETLVAISILMIAIAGPLVIANKSLTAALYAKDQMIASYLAQEGVETLRNRKDNNILTGEDWLHDIRTQKSGGGWGYGNDCITNTPQGHNEPCLVDDITRDPQFKLSYYLFKIGNGSDSNEYALTVTVTWNEGKIANSMSITTELTNLAL